MPRLVLHFLVMSVLGAFSAFGQGTLAHIAFGECWQTTFTFINTNAQSAASGTLFFYGDDGSPLNAPVQGVGNVTSYPFTISANGAVDIVLPRTDSNLTWGWARMTSDGAIIRGQGRLSCQHPASPAFEAVVPLTTSGSPECIIPIPPSSNPVILLPFDNTTGQHFTALALANATNAALTVPVEFDDQFNHPLVTATLNVAAMNHTSFVTTAQYPALAGSRGILRIKASTASLAVLGLLFAPGTITPFTTIIPVIQ